MSDGPTLKGMMGEHLGEGNALVSNEDLLLVKDQIHKGLGQDEK
jgi:hypothetical protein